MGPLDKLAFWVGASAFLTYRDPKWWDFWNELLPNTQSVKDTAFTFLNPTKCDSKSPVSAINENPNLSSLTALLPRARVVPETGGSHVFSPSTEGFPHPGL